MLFVFQWIFIELTGKIGMLKIAHFLTTNRVKI